MEALDLVSLIVHAPRWVRFAVSAIMALWTFATTLTLALRLVPEATFAKMEAASPRLGHFFRAWRKFGTDVLPFFKELAKAVIKTKLPPSVTALVFVVPLLGCSGGPVRVQADIAHQAAQAWNQVGRPTLVRAFEEDQRAALDRVCPAVAAPCPSQPMRDAVQTVRARWAPLWDSLEAVRVAHDLWRVELESCRRAPDAGAACLPDVQRLGASFVARTGTWRCLLRVIGHPELDSFPGQPQCAIGGRDAG